MLVAHVVIGELEHRLVRMARVAQDAHLELPVHNGRRRPLCLIVAAYFKLCLLLLLGAAVGVDGKTRCHLLSEMASEEQPLQAEVLDDAHAAAVLENMAQQLWVGPGVEFLFVPHFYCPHCGASTRYPFPLLMAYMRCHVLAHCSRCGRMVCPMLVGPYR